MLGLSRATSAGHIARATLEAIALQTDDVLRAVATDAGAAPSEVRVDGGAAANDLLMQIQADVLGMPVVRPRWLETSALGVASLAGLAAGWWRNRDEIVGRDTERRRFEPRMAAGDRDRLRAAWARGLDRTRG